MDSLDYNDGFKMTLFKINKCLLNKKLTINFMIDPNGLVPGKYHPKIFPSQLNSYTY